MALQSQYADEQDQGPAKNIDHAIRSLKQWQARGFSISLTGSWHNHCMHAEAVRSGAVASKTGLMHDGNRVLTCYECGIQYHLHYDNEAEQLLTFYSVLACEVITARHPLHVNNIVLQLPNTRRP